MKIERIVDIDVRVGEGRTLRMQEEVEFELDPEEAVRLVLGTSQAPETKDRLLALLNNFARFIKAVPDEAIAELSPEARQTVAGFLDGCARRFTA